jgi:hypothetical protein
MEKMFEDIKKGLECSVTETCSGRACPYFNRDSARCIRESRRNALARIQQLEAQVPRWIPVEERLPEDDEMYLDITHWMPLPQPHKEEEKE